jgi:hypothetical protein
MIEGYLRGDVNCLLAVQTLEYFLQSAWISSTSFGTPVVAGRLSEKLLSYSADT